jgi:hypothetical protein
VNSSPLSKAAKTSREQLSLAGRANSKPAPDRAERGLNFAAVINEKRRRTTTGLVFALSATSSERRILPGLAASVVSK